MTDGRIKPSEKVNVVKTVLALFMLIIGAIGIITGIILFIFVFSVAKNAPQISENLQQWGENTKRQLEENPYCGREAEAQITECIMGGIPESSCRNAICNSQLLNNK